MRHQATSDPSLPSVEREVIFHTGTALSDARYRSTNLSTTQLVSNLSPLVNSYYSNIALAGGLTDDLGGSPLSNAMKSRDLCSPGVGTTASNLLSIFPHLNTIITKPSSKSTNSCDFLCTVLFTFLSACFIAFTDKKLSFEFFLYLHEIVT